MAYVKLIALERITTVITSIATFIYLSSPFPHQHHKHQNCANDKQIIASERQSIAPNPRCTRYFIVFPTLCRNLLCLFNTSINSLSVSYSASAKSDTKNSKTHETVTHSIMSNNPSFVILHLHIYFVSLSSLFFIWLWSKKL